jgi:hypothetical protein
MRTAIAGSSRRTPSWRIRAGVMVLLTIVSTIAQAGGPWWNASWSYRVRVTAGANGFARFDKAAETTVNFTTLLSALGKSGALDENSLRVIETDAAGTILNTAVPFQFDKASDFNASTKASGTMVILLGGTTGSSATRYFDIYFNETGGSFSPASFSPLIAIDENSSDMGQAAFRIDGPGVTMYYQTEAGAFSTMLDKDYNDWLSWGFDPGPGGIYRGTPNAIFPEGWFHPGATSATSTVTYQGPLKITISTVTNDGNWACRWEVYPRYATMTMLKQAHGYWFLYEGTPGGSLNGGEDFMYRSNGTKTMLYEAWEQDIPGDEWAFFSDPNVRRSFFAVHHESDALLDSYYNYSDSMTVFGFGRSNDPLAALMTATPQHFTIGLLEDTSYTKNKDSINSSFKALSIALGSPELPGPDVPVLVSPADGATNVGVPALLRWRTSDRATGYRVQVATSNTFASGVVLDDSTITDTTKSVSGLSGKTTYYWRVSAKNAVGGSGFATARSFVTGLDTPVLSTPADGATGRQQPVALSWSPVSGATGYHVQVSTESGFSSGLVVDDASVSSTSRSVSGLLPVTMYYWRVAGRDAGGDGSYAAARTFTTALAAPALVSPADNAANQPQTLTLQWSALAGATAYHVQVATDAGFSTGVILDDAGVTSTSTVVSGLLQSTTYYWRVSAANAGGEGAFSTARSFSTQFPAPALLSPAASATGQPTAITLLWGKVDGAVRYHLQLATDSVFTAFIKNDTTITDTSRQVVALSNSTWYYWRVAAKTNAVTGPFSGMRSFRTIGVMPGTVQLVSPATGAQFKPDSVRITWRRATNATRYWVDVATDSLFLLRQVDSTVTDTTKMVRNLPLNAKAWWRVRGGTSEGWGAFSEVRRFSMDGPTGVQTSGEIPGTYALRQNYPNPFNPSTVIGYDLPAAGMVRLEVFNMLGESAGILVDEYRSAGYHEARFNAGGLSSGTYFYRMTVNGTVITRRMLLLR